MYGDKRRGGFGRDRGFGGGGGGRGFGGGGGREFDDKPKPVKIGQEYDVEITSVGSKGDGITKVENFVVFVAGARKGEKCRIKIKEVSNKFAIGEKVSSSGSSESESEEGEEETQEEESSEEQEASEEEYKEEE